MSDPSCFWPIIRAVGRALTIPGTKVGLSVLTDMQDKLTDRRFRHELLKHLAAIASDVSATARNLHAEGIEAAEAELQLALSEISEQIYRREVADDFRYADFKGIWQWDRIASIEIDDLFVGLRVQRVAPGAGWRAIFAESEEKAAQASVAHDDGGSGKSSETLDTSRPATFESLLAHPGVTVLLGGPGSGKTTLVKRLARMAALGTSNQRLRLAFAPADLFPVVLPLTTFDSDRDGRDLLGYLQHRLGKLWGTQIERVFLDHWSAGQCLLLLDGLDEIAALSGRISTARAIDSLVGTIGHNRAIVTSRVVGYGACAISAPAAHAAVLPFGRSDIQQFVQQWHAAFERAMHPEGPDQKRASREARSLLDDISRSPRVRSLARNPLMLTILSLIKHQSVQLPERRVELYEVIINTLMRSWGRARSLASSACEPAGDLGIEDAKKLWAAIAYWMHDTRNRTVSRSSLHTRLTEDLVALGKDELDASRLAESYLRTAAEQSGILEERGADEFAFLHQTFQEYLAAQHVVLRRPYRDQISRIVALASDPRWHEVIRLATGFIGVVQKNDEAATEVVEQLLRSTDPLEPFIASGLRLAAACIADDVRADAKCAEYVVQRLCEALLTAHGRLLQDELALLLRTMRSFVPGPHSTTALIRLIHHKNWLVRMEVGRQLARVAVRPEAIVALKQLLADMDPDVQAHAAIGLLSIQDPGTDQSILLRHVSYGIQSSHANMNPLPDALLTEVAQNLLNGGSPAAVLRAADLLVQSGKSDEAAALLRPLLTEEAAFVRFRALTLLLELKEEDGTLLPLMELLKEREGYLRRSAARILDAKGLHAEAVEHMSNMLSTNDDETRMAAVEMLAEWGEHNHAGTALGLLLDSTSEDVRLRAARVAVAADLKQEAACAARDLLSSDDQKLRSEAAEFLHELGCHQEAVETLQELLDSKDDEVRFISAQLLVSWGHYERATETLLDLARQADNITGPNAIFALATLGPSPAILDTLFASLTSHSGASHSAAAHVLSSWKSERSVLLRLLHELRSNKDGAIATFLLDCEEAQNRGADELRDQLALELSSIAIASADTPAFYLLLDWIWTATGASLTSELRRP